MCYSGKCRYEDISGECLIRHLTVDAFPIDAKCVDPDKYLDLVELYPEGFIDDEAA